MNQISLFLKKPYLAFFYTLLVLVLCFMTSENISKNVDDKMAHFVAFVGISFLWLWVKPKYIIVILSTIVLGFVIEFIQGQLPESFHRGYELLDGFADGIGAFIGGVLYFLSLKILSLGHKKKG